MNNQEKTYYVHLTADSVEAILSQVNTHWQGVREAMERAEKTIRPDERPQGHGSRLDMNREEAANDWTALAEAIDTSIGSGYQWQANHDPAHSARMHAKWTERRKLSAGLRTCASRLPEAL